MTDRRDRTWFCLAPNCTWETGDVAEVHPHLMAHAAADMIVALVLHLLVLGIVAHHVRRDEQ